MTMAQPFADLRIQYNEIIARQAAEHYTLGRMYIRKMNGNSNINHNYITY